ncbi:bifunctional ADP-dependent NAD(P)H-hydrate dehydratase/NAD(P)H-hydrate epimerase [Shewanella sp. Choline-02u-19]|uniref:NAD(P)H-hydrate dehydratase n=1 Tax=unclassified Shewanella TaxID=196818 RepID=UPI000C327EB0|nr:MULTISPECIES: NAD(P)H-hydrate dehydratase [unclassified Shewanella]PKG55631.1 bifunctional ADP-dependent NAD(P)H-hydrate dehydratase/NAD(P)H-hydrate epimerase [Shewanella sp. GutDb-MelDb]PKG76511.1 bifunctional ADP-dependent NAD(P)H-hydrate dehydratase/NAD(P)H-hydrate epimerase [Shewanella sp. GutCb]PKH55441.1 bifunctional ADP-dependent NAD(P)H-hydrate dehydratase/NAD(P)H-hydrate epimerase [Shewanella sp. Bg11-22]PKI28788.1 bifunctional ADP-dependent NAD(P)H-hydrate dehydratase/NAD(P)H-hydra
MNEKHLSALVSLYSVEQVREAEASAVRCGKTSLYELVERAAAAAFEQLQTQSGNSQTILVLAGHGNNAADAYVTASLLIKAGRTVYLQASAAHNPTAELLLAIAHFERVGGKTCPFCIDRIVEAEVIVDGLLGTGARGELSDELVAIISAVNRSSAWVVSLDVPSGIESDTGITKQVAIEASITLTFGGIKQGLLTSQARHFCGKLLLADIGLTPFLPLSEVKKLVSNDLPNIFLPRRRDSHKGDSGKVTVIGGDFGMSGAIRLASESCLRAGAGLVTVISRPEHHAVVCTTRPELMFWGCELVDMEVYLKLGWANVLVIGPGLGTTDWGYNLLKAVDLAEKPSVIDADALNLLCHFPLSNKNWVLTPHPGEAGRLLGVSTEEVEKDRFKAVRTLHKKYGGVIVLKGAGTLIYDGNDCLVAPVGNPGLASGGCGDVLSGIIGALMAQGFSNMQAAYIAVVIHGDAADLAAKDGERGMLASDLMSYIHQLVNEI